MVIEISNMFDFHQFSPTGLETTTDLVNISPNSQKIQLPTGRLQCNGPINMAEKSQVNIETLYILNFDIL